MIKLEYKNKYSTFSDSSEIAKLIFDVFSIGNIEVFKAKSLNKNKAKNLLLQLETIITEKVNNVEQNSLKEIKDVDFGKCKIALNLRSASHKEAFFLIKSYNLIFSFVTENDSKLTLEKMNDSDFVFNAS